MNKYSTESIIKALKATNGMCSLAAKKIGCTLATIHNRANSTPSIRQAIEDARSEMIDIAEQKLKQAILNGEPWAIALTLKTIGKGRGYVERTELDAGLAAGGILKIIVERND